MSSNPENAVRNIINKFDEQTWEIHSCPLVALEEVRLPPQQGREHLLHVLVREKVHQFSCPVSALREEASPQNQKSARPDLIRGPQLQLRDHLPLLREKGQEQEGRSLEKSRCEKPADRGNDRYRTPETFGAVWSRKWAFARRLFFP